MMHVTRVIAAASGVQDSVVQWSLSSVAIPAPLHPIFHPLSTHLYPSPFILRIKSSHERFGPELEFLSASSSGNGSVSHLGRSLSLPLQCEPVNHERLY